MDRLLFFDLETCGLNPLTDPIIELAAVAVDSVSFRTLDSFNIKVQFDADACNPRFLGHKYDAQVWQVAALPEDTSAELLAAFLKRHATDHGYNPRTKTRFPLARLVAHNGEQHDGPFLHAWYKRLGMACPAARMCLCTKQKALWFFQENPSLPKPENFRLHTLCEYFGTKTRPNHHALADIESTIQLYRALLEHTTGLNVEQRDYLAAISQETGLSHQQLVNRAINRLAGDMNLAV